MLDTRADHRDAAGMSEDTPNVARPEAAEPATAIEAGTGGLAAGVGSASPMASSAVLADQANPASVRPAGGAAANEVRPEVNKLHEWGAAVAIMAFLTLVFLGFLFFFRGISL
ncbi:MAG: hypothetical protein BGO98_04885 [Myxococcales bacterium 68-20]|nr:MAG: hypothetical protein BGO98_04885 [Myxococcales bacterium 68-20]